MMEYQYHMMEYQYLPEDSFDFLMVGHHVNEEVDSNLKSFFQRLFSFFIGFSAQLKIVGCGSPALTLVTCSSSTDQEPLRMATSASVSQCISVSVYQCLTLGKERRTLDCMEALEHKDSADVIL